METPDILKLTLYGIFVFIALPVIYLIGQKLFTRGRIFLKGIFNEEEMSESINRLLLIGYYLVTAGIFFLDFSVYAEIDTVTELIERLATKLGALFLILGVIHIINVLVFLGIRFLAKRFNSSRYATQQ